MTARESRPATNEAAQISTATNPQIPSSMHFPGVRCGACGHRRYVVTLDGRRVCPDHETPADAQLVDALEERGRAIGVRDGRWPYGPNVYLEMRLRMVQWAEANRLTLVDLDAHRCTNFVLQGNCRSTTCRARQSAGDWFDHVTLWKRHGEPAVLVAQPYHLDDADQLELGVLSRTPGVRLELLAQGGWYGVGTWFIGLWREGA